MGGSSYGKEYVCNCVFNLLQYLLKYCRWLLSVRGVLSVEGVIYQALCRPPSPPNTPPGSSNPQTPPKHPPRLPTLLAILPFFSYTPPPANPLSSFSQFSSQLSVT